MTTIELYVKFTTNCPGGMPLTFFELLSEEWEGDSLILPFGDPERGGVERKKVVGWCDLLFNRSYRDVPGCPTTVHCAKVRTVWNGFPHADGSEHIGYLVYGGNSGVRIGGEKGWGQAVVWIALEDVNDLPAQVRKIVTVETAPTPLAE